MSTNLLNEPKAIEAIVKELTKLADDESRKRVLDYIYSGYNIKKQSEVLGGVANSPSGNPLIASDIFELWTNKSPSNNYEKLALLGYYLEYVRQMKEFTREDLENAWGETREPLPSKQVLTNSLNDTVSKYKYLLSVRKGSYRMARRGFEVAAALPNITEELKGHVKKGAKKKTKKK